MWGPNASQNGVSLQPHLIIREWQHGDEISQMLYPWIRHIELNCSVRTRFIERYLINPTSHQAFLSRILA